MIKLEEENIKVIEENKRILRYNKIKLGHKCKN